jgi:histone H4
MPRSKKAPCAKPKRPHRGPRKFAKDPERIFQHAAIDRLVRQEIQGLNVPRAMDVRISSEAVAAIQALVEKRVKTLMISSKRFVSTCGERVGISGGIVQAVHNIQQDGSSDIINDLAVFKPKARATKARKVVEGAKKKHVKILRDNEQGITRVSVRRAAEAADIPRVSSEAVNVVRGLVQAWLKEFAKAAVTIAQHYGRITIMPEDVKIAGKMNPAL